MTSGFVKNIFGTLALAVADEMQLAVREASRHGASAPAALATLYADPGLSIEQLRHAVGVTHSGAVRLVDRLEEDGLVRREAGFGRRVSLHLTPAGERLATDVLPVRRRSAGRWPR